MDTEAHQAQSILPPAAMAPVTPAIALVANAGADIMNVKAFMADLVNKVLMDIRSTLAKLWTQFSNALGRVREEIQDVSKSVENRR